MRVVGGWLAIGCAEQSACTVEIGANGLLRGYGVAAGGGARGSTRTDEVPSGLREPTRVLQVVAST